MLQRADQCAAFSSVDRVCIGELLTSTVCHVPSNLLPVRPQTAGVTWFGPLLCLVANCFGKLTLPPLFLPPPTPCLSFALAHNGLWNAFAVYLCCAYSQAKDLASAIVEGLAFCPLPKSLFPQDRAVDLRAFASRGCKNLGITSRGKGRTLQHDVAEPPELHGNTDGASEEQRGQRNSGQVQCEGVSHLALYPEYRRSFSCPNPEETNAAAYLSFQVRTIIFWNNSAKRCPRTTVKLRRRH